MKDRSTSIKLSPTVSIPDAEPAKAVAEFEAGELEDQALRGVERYRILETIGRGGMGLVLKTRDTDFDRFAALKILLKRHQGNDAMHLRFFEEAQITGQLQHPGIVSVYEMGTSQSGRPYFAMKLIEGQTMSELLAEMTHSQLEQTRMLNVFAKVCEAIAYAHARGVIHLDLKPSNVMIGSHGEVHVMDWGLSRRIDSIPELVQAQLSDHVLRDTDSSQSRITGTPAYMPPEQARGQSIGMFSDVFGLGAVLCEILTGDPPFCGRNIQQVYRRAANASLRAAFERLDACNVEAGIIALAKRCLSSKPGRRPADAGVVAAEINTFVESSMERAERDLCRFFDISMDLFCIASLDGFFKRVNTNFSRVLGYSDRELVSRPFLDFVHPDDVAETIQAVQTLSEGKPVAEFRNRYVHADGHYVSFEWTAKSFPGENVIFAVAREITE